MGSELPLIVREKIASKTCKMVFVNGIIIVMVVLILAYYNNNNYLNFNLPHIYDINEQSKIHNQSVIKKNTELSGNMIRLISQNYTPVVKIVIIDTDRNVIPLFTTNKMQKKLPDKRSVIEYHISKPVKISRIIIDIDMMNTSSKNITNTNVEIVNNGQVIWLYDKKLSYKKYNYVHICEPPSDNILKHEVFYNSTESSINQEIKLMENLIDNVYGNTN
jgi:hypothetical protein